MKNRRLLFRLFLMAQVALAVAVPITTRGAVQPTLDADLTDMIQAVRWLIIVVSLGGLLFFRAWARPLFVAITLLSLPAAYLYSEPTFSHLSLIRLSAAWFMHGMTAVLIYTAMSSEFMRYNKALQADGPRPAGSARA